MAADRQRCFWVSLDKPYYVDYHDTEWGVPVHDDRRHFEMLILEGAQAGLSWETILRKRENYRRAFAGFDPAKVARFSPPRIEKLLLDPGLVRNRLKIHGAVKNARVSCDPEGTRDLRCLRVAVRREPADRPQAQGPGGCPRENRGERRPLK